jgi:hypothetical protein
MSLICEIITKKENKMTDQQFQRLLELLGQVGSTAYQAALQQVYVNANLKLFWGIAFLTGLIFGGIIIWLGIKQMDKDMQTPKSYGNDNDSGAGIVFFGIVVCVGSLVLACLNFSDAYTYILSPQWQAIQLMSQLVIK